MIFESEKKGELFEALANAQAEFPTIRSNRKAYLNSYADLYAILKPIYPILKKYGLSISSYAGVLNEKEIIGVRLAHKSDQFIINYLYFKPEVCKNPKDQASHKEAGTITYMNRSFVKNILGVLISEDPEDNDMQEHEDIKPAENRTYKSNNDDKINSDQLEIITKVLTGNPKTAATLFKNYNLNHLEDLLKIDFYEALDKCRSHINKIKLEEQVQITK